MTPQTGTMAKPCSVVSFLQFLAVMQRHIVKDDEALSAETFSTTAGNRRRIDSDEFMSKVGEIFKHMDVRGDGEVSWEDFSSVS